MESIKKKLDKYFENLDSYKYHDFLYRIDGKVYDDIMACFDPSKSVKQGDCQDIIRKKITKKLNLKRLDTVFFIDSAIYIKIFISIDDKDGGDRRACGVDLELLEAYKKKYFSDDLMKKYTLEVLAFVAEDILSFRRLNPYDFKKIFICVFINMMELIVIEKTKIDSTKNIKGFSLYLLREMFDDFLLYITEEILFYFSNQDKQAIAFVSFFNVNETIDAKGIKYKANPIIDSNQHAWNLTTIRSTMVQYKHAKKDTYNKKATFLNAKKKLNRYDSELKDFEEQKEDMRLIHDDIYIKIKSNGNNIEKIKKSTSDKVRFIDDGIEKVYDKKVIFTKLFKKEDKLLDEKKSIDHEIKDIDTKISNKQKDFDIWTKKYNESEELLKAIDEKGHPIDKQYKKLQEALAKTLAKR